MAHTTTETNPGSTAAQAKKQAKQQAEQVKRQADQARWQAKDKLREVVDQRSTLAGERVGSTAQDVRTVAEELRKQGKDQPAKLAEQAADRVERVGGYLKESDADGILRDVEDLGRTKPWALAVGGLALGFAASRFLKASSSRRYEQIRGDAGYARRRSLPAGAQTGRPAAPAAGYPPAGTSM
jgi:hypothetical protein